MRITKILLSLPLFLAGCVSASLDHSTQADTTPSPAPAATAPQFVFTSDFGYHGVGTRTPGTVGTIVYDTRRLPKCRAEESSVPAWSLSAFVSADGGPAVQHTFATPSVEGPVQIDFVIPFAKDLAFWFWVNDTAGCQQWDSDYGANFHFSVNSPTDAVLHLAADYSSSIDGTIIAGEPLTVDYDFARLAECRGTYNGNPAWSITMWSQIDGGTPVSQELDKVINVNDRVALPGQLTLPLSSHDLALWFESDDVDGCHAYDSAYGANYHFAIH